MLKGFKFKSKAGNSNISIVETETPNTISIGVIEGGVLHVVELDRSDWIDLCDLKYKIDFAEPEQEPEARAPFVAMPAESVAGEVL